MGDDAGAPAPAEPDAASLMAIRMAEHQLQSGLRPPASRLRLQHRAVKCRQTLDFSFAGLQHPGQQLGGGMLGAPITAHLHRRGVCIIKLHFPTSCHLDSVREAGPDFSGVLGHMAGMAGIMAGMPGVAWPGVVNGPGWPVGPAGVHSIQVRRSLAPPRSQASALRQGREPTPGRWRALAGARRPAAPRLGRAGGQAQSWRRGGASERR